MTTKPSQVVYIFGLVLLMLFLGFVDFQVVKNDSIEYGRENHILQDQALVSNEQLEETYSYACGRMVSTESNPGEFVSIGNPAAEYCKKLGHEFNTITHPDGSQDGTCSIPGRTACDAWDFLQGKCGQEFNACAQQGLQTRTISDGKNAFTREYAVCVDKNGEQISSATDMVNLYSSTVSDGGFIQKDEIIESPLDAATLLKGEDSPSNIDAVPSYFDWRIYNGSNWVTPVKNQGSCGSCWSFSAVGVTEAIYNIASHNPDLDLDLSEQFLVSDCHVVSTAQHCCGGWKSSALEYIRDSGIPDEDCMSYIDGSGCTCNGSCNDDCEYYTGDDCSNTICSDRCGDWASRLTNISSVGSVGTDPTAIKQALIDYGPLSVSYGWGPDYGGDFDGDIYRCEEDTGTNHAVVMVGYNDAGGYWIIKNSWGTSYEDNGYFKLGYGECYIEQYVYYADVVGVPYAEIEVSPGSFEESLIAGETVTRTLTISSTGGANLSWTIDEEDTTGASGFTNEYNLDSTKAALVDVVLYDNGPLVNCTGCGAGGADTSELQSSLGMTLYGFGHQVSTGNRISDDFTVSDPTGWNLSEITFYAYQTGSGTTSTITALNLRIWDGPPDEPSSNVVFGDTTTNRMATTSWTNVYRVSETTSGNTDRPIMSVEVDVNTALPPGTYWLDWQADGSSSISGPWAPPITINGQTTTGNALQYTVADGWNPVEDDGTSTLQGFPFIIEGSLGVECLVPLDIPWLQVSPTNGTTSPDSYTLADITFDSTGMSPGTYSGNLCINSNDPVTPLVVVPLTLDVEPYRVFIPLLIR